MKDPITTALERVRIRFETPNTEWLRKCSEHLDMVAKQRMERNKDETPV